METFTRMVALVATIVMVSGCSMGSFVTFLPQSNFSYPNSNVTPIGAAKGESSTWSVFFPVFSDADMQQEAIEQAVKSKGGDMLIDYVGTSRITMYPLGPIYIYQTTYIAEGTVAKMEIGKQILH